jgi:hypothetical protein
VGKSLVGKTTINRFTETDNRKEVASGTYCTEEATCSSDSFLLYLIDISIY